ncbi:hypothetical protein ABT024_35640 [Streptomyces sp. NPDC002812]|uniref:hypothetical protein n=1 Tax=Streptomyces sp. NPDC002812 TaxID=3154434 RepID=UPI0033191D37
MKKRLLEPEVTAGGTVFSGFRASVGPYRSVQVSGTFEYGEIPAGTTSLEVDIQYSPDGRTGWTTRKSFDVPTGAGANEWAVISQVLPYSGAPGYVRLRYAGTPAIRGSVTPAVRVERTMTAIPDFNAAPEPVRTGRPHTLTGRLSRLAPVVKPMAGQRIDYYFRPAGSTAWTHMGGSVTAADGTFRKSFTATRTGSWYARYEHPDAAHFAAASRVDEVVVTL